MIDFKKSKKLRCFKGKLIDFIFLNDDVPLSYLDKDFTPNFDGKKKKKHINKY